MTTPKLLRDYRRERAKGFAAQWAIRNARTRQAWDDAESEELVRLRVEPDDSACLEDLEGDCFNPRANPDIPASKLARQREALIHEDYFKTYAQELVQDIGDLPNGIPSYIEIDWEATADNIRQDYTSVEFDGVTYYVR